MQRLAYGMLLSVDSRREKLWALTIVQMLVWKRLANGQSKSDVVGLGINGLVNLRTPGTTMA